MTKICVDCGREFPATTEYFLRKKGGKLGLSACCRKCHNERNRKFREKHPDCNANYYKENKEAILQKQKEYYLKHRDKYLERFRIYRKQYYKENIEKITEYRREYTKKHPDYFKNYYNENKQRWKLRYLANREKILKRDKERRSTPEYRERAKRLHEIWYSNPINKERILHWKQQRRNRERNLENTLTLEQWNEVLEHFDYKCAYCGNAGKLTKEHIVPMVKGGGYTKNNIIPACQRCNSSKCDSDLMEWYPKQDFYSKERLQTILRVQNDV